MPTIKQKKAVRDTLENLGSPTPKSQGEILLENGYAPSIAKNPKIITESKGWKELMDEYMPNDLLAKVHREGLSAASTTRRGEEEIVEPDYAIRHKYLDSAYKLKGSYAAEKTQSLNLNLDVSVPNEEVEALRQEFEDKLKAKYTKE